MLVIGAFFYHPPPIAYHRQCNYLVCRESKPPCTIWLYESNEKAIKKIGDDESIESIPYPPFSLPWVESNTKYRKKYRKKNHLIYHRRMSWNPISKIHSPRKGSWESIGEVAKSCGDSTKSTDKDSEHNSWQEKYTSRNLYMMQVFVGFCCNYASKECPCYRLREKYASLRIAPRDHCSVECWYDHTAEHRSCDNEQVVFWFFSCSFEWIWQFWFCEHLFIKKPRHKERGNIASKVIEDFYFPICKVKFCHRLELL